MEFRLSSVGYASGNHRLGLLRHGITILLLTVATLASSFDSGNIGLCAEIHRAPNIVYILADDLGYGDVHCLNPQRGKIPTPNIDRLAADGMIFTDAHSGSAVCTPTRYGILTGRYCWRTHLHRGVLLPYDRPLIAASQLTVPAFLRQHGYDTACIGKWHLGWNWPIRGKQPDFTRPITEGPTARGFDFYFGVDVPNYPPYCFIENERTVGIPSTPLPARLLGHNLASQPGLALPGWKLEAVLPGLTAKACEYIQTHANSGKPFFLYFPLTSPHTPLAPTDAWKGKSGLNTYADFVMETDAMIGEVLQAVQQNGIADTTLVICTSDNGCAPYIGVADLERMGHYPSHVFRGYKADIWEGGHHIPFLARWPGRIKAGSTCRDTICLTDLLTTSAAILGARLPDDAGVDSVSILPDLLGTAKGGVREATVHQSIQGALAIRQGKWKLEFCPGSGGWGTPNDPQARRQKLPEMQLYDMTRDISERHNVQAEHPEIVQRLRKLLQKYIDDGRSTPGPKQPNDLPVPIIHGEKGKASNAA